MSTPKSLHGFTLIEMMLAVGLMSFISFAAFSYFKSFNQQVFTADSRMSSDLEALVLDRVIRNEIIKVEPSFNFLTILDDNGPNFYDFVPDQVCTSNCSRLIRLSPDSRIKSFPMLNSHRDAGLTRLYTPTFAYDVSGDNDLTTAATLTYQGVNGGSSGGNERYLEKLLGRGHPDPSKQATYNSVKSMEYPLLMFTSLVEMRNIPGGDTLDDPPRRSTYLGMLDTSNFSMSATNPQNLFQAIHPMDSTVIMDDVAVGDQSSPAYGVDGFDRFLRTLPPVGGVGAIAYLKFVRLSRITFEPGPDGEKEENRVFLQSWQTDPQSSDWESPGFQAGSNLYAIDFIRRDISSSIIEVKIWAKDPPPAAGN